MINIAGIVKESIVDGPGVRTTIFVQGCSHQCPGCHNPQTWDYGGGVLIGVDEVLEEIKSDYLATGVTLSGGEPLDHADLLLPIVKGIKTMGKDLIVYTGYTWEYIQFHQYTSSLPGTESLLQEIDYLIDGRYIEEQKDLSLLYRGSANQRIIDVRQSLMTGKLVQANL